MNFIVRLIGLGILGWMNAFFVQTHYYPSDQFQERELIRQVETDSMRYELWLIYDETGEPQQYMADIFTPVCYSNKCYPVFIDFYWDLLGNFKRYEVPSGKPLTKLDHIPFEEHDYEKLHEILTNTSSMLKDYRAEDLVVDNREELTQGVDAVTGATLKTLQNQVISGAVYSCYTLWHLAHGEMAAIARQHTEKIHDEKMLIRFLKSPDHRYQYWALEKVFRTERYAEAKFADPMLAILRSKNIFIAQNLLENIPAEMLENTERQEWLWETYLSSPYRLQLAILDKLDHLDLQPGLIEKMIDGLENSNAEQKRKIFTVLKGQKDLSKRGQKNLALYLDDNHWRKEVYHVLSNQRKLDRSVRIELNQTEFEQ